MALIHCSFYSEALRIGTDVNVIIPTPHPMEDPINPGDYFHEGAKYQTLYLLHGSQGDYTDWQRFTSIELFAQLSKLMVVMPSGANALYQDMVYGPQYFTYLTEELPRFIRTMFPSSPKREDTFIGGLSMGALGAFNCGIRKPDVYSKVVALSGCLSMQWRAIVDINDPAADTWPLRAILPPPFDGKGTGLDDEPVLLQHIEDGTVLPDFYLAVGTEDPLYPLAQMARSVFDRPEICFTYEEGPGGHDWTFWNTYIQKAIDWLDLKKTTV